jgi:tetratricopeptide (TPR) repeat protein
MCLRDCRFVVCLFLMLVAVGCKGKPVPPEVQEAALQEQVLWRAGAALYAPKEYDQYLKSLREAKDKLIKEKAKLPLMQNYEEAQVAFQDLLKTGDDLLEKVDDQKLRRSEAISSQIASFTKRLDTAKKLSRMINEGRFARALLIRTELKVREGDLLSRRGDFIEAEKKLKEATPYLQDVEDLVFSVLNRYRDKSLLEKWETWIRETISESKQNRAYAITVTKIDRKLAVYKEGQLFSTFKVGLGPNSLADKLHAGDNATPEGKYRIVKKIPVSHFHKALLLNYPNEEDQKRFVQGKAENIIPSGVGIGGLIEIHGGGMDSITNGCISLENGDLDKFYDLIDVGTTVTIVGSTRRQNELFFGHSR